jgi:hypothetical protein
VVDARLTAPQGGKDRERMIDAFRSIGLAPQAYRDLSRIVLKLFGFIQ